MAKPKKKNQLPSGQFRVQVYDYTDDDGKKHYKSFTAASKNWHNWLRPSGKQIKISPPQL